MQKTMHWFKRLECRLRAWAARPAPLPGYPLWPGEWETMRLHEALRQSAGHAAVARDLRLVVTAAGWAVPAPGATAP